MKCFTATIRRNGLFVEAGITLPYHANNNGLWASVESSALALARAMLADDNAYDCRDGRLIVWHCNIVSEAKSLRIVPSDEKQIENEDQATSLRIVRRSETEVEAESYRIVPSGETESDRSALIMVDSDSEMTTEDINLVVARGYRIVGHPLTGSAMYEWRKRLFKLQPGDSIVVSIVSRSAFLFGFPVARGVAVDVRIEYDGDGLKMTLENRHPVVESFSGFELQQDASLLGVLLAISATIFSFCVWLCWEVIESIPVSFVLLLAAQVIGLFLAYRAAGILGHLLACTQKYRRGTLP